MKSTVRRSQRDYSLAFKLSVVDQVERGELTYKTAQERYGIQGPQYGAVLASPSWPARLVRWGIISSHEYCP